MDNHSRILRDYGWFYGIRGKPANPSVVTQRAEVVFSDGQWRFPKDLEGRDRGQEQGRCHLESRRHPITELELATVAFAALNFVIYVLWRDKPQNVQRGVRVYKKRMTEESVDDGSAEATVGFWGALRDALSEIPSAIVRGPDLPGLTHLPWLNRVFFWPIVKPVAVLISGDGAGGDRVRVRVNTFYPSRWVASSEMFSVFLVATITVAFGAIHCIGWSFDFPSNIERTLWRVASLSITGVPILIIPSVVLGETIDEYFFTIGDSDFWVYMITTLLFFL